MNTGQLLDLARDKVGGSDYRLAMTLGVGQSTLSNYRNGRSRPDDRMARRLAELADLDPGQVAAWLQVERAKDDDSRAMWRDIAQRLAKSAAVGLVAGIGVSITPDAGAMSNIGGVSTYSTTHNIQSARLYIMSTRRRRGLVELVRLVGRRLADLIGPRGDAGMVPA